MSYPNTDTDRTTTDLSDHEDQDIERRAYAAEGLDPDDPAVDEAIARTQDALRRLAEKIGTDRVRALAQDRGLSIDSAL